MASKRKYNPNKRLHQAQSKAAMQRKEWEEVNQVYELQMDFVVEDVNKIINEYVEKNMMSDNDYVPSHVVVEAYDQQDLIIALKKQLVATPEIWQIGIDSHFYNLETDELLTIPFSLTMPAMTHSELMNGCEQKVYEVDGVKVKKADEWQGLQNEMIANWEKQGIPDGFELIKSQVRIIAHTRFKCLAAYKDFEHAIELRKQGLLIKRLKNFDNFGLGVAA